MKKFPHAIVIAAFIFNAIPSQTIAQNLQYSACTSFSSEALSAPARWANRVLAKSSSEFQATHRPRVRRLSWIPLGELFPAVVRNDGLRSTSHPAGFLRRVPVLFLKDGESKPEEFDDRFLRELAAGQISALSRLNHVNTRKSLVDYLDAHLDPEDRLDSDGKVRVFILPHGDTHRLIAINPTSHYDIESGKLFVRVHGSPAFKKVIPLNEAKQLPVSVRAVAIEGSREDLFDWHDTATLQDPSQGLDVGVTTVQVLEFIKEGVPEEHEGRAIVNATARERFRIQEIIAQAKNRTTVLQHGASPSVLDGMKRASTLHQTIFTGLLEQVKRRQASLEFRLPDALGGQSVNFAAELQRANIALVTPEDSSPALYVNEHNRARFQVAYIDVATETIYINAIAFERLSPQERVALLFRQIATLAGERAMGAHWNIGLANSLNHAIDPLDRELTSESWTGHYNSALEEALVGIVRGGAARYLQRQYKLLEEKRFWNLLIVTTTSEAWRVFLQALFDSLKGVLYPHETEIVVLSEEKPLGNWGGTIEAFKVIEEHMARVPNGRTLILHTAGDGKRNNPLTGASITNKGHLKLPGVMGGRVITNMIQALRQSLQLYMDAAEGSFQIVATDSLYVVAEDIRGGDQLFKVIGRSMPLEPQYWQFGRLIRHPKDGTLALMKEKKQPEEVLREMVDLGYERPAPGAKPLDVEINTAMYSGSYKLISPIITTYTQLVAALPPELRKLDTSKHFLEAMTMSREQAIAADLNLQIWQTAQDFRRDHLPGGIGVVNMGKASYFNDTGTNEGFYKTFASLDPLVRAVLGHHEIRAQVDELLDEVIAEARRNGILDSRSIKHLKADLRRHFGARTKIVASPDLLRKVLQEDLSIELGRLDSGERKFRIAPQATVTASNFTEGCDIHSGALVMNTELKYLSTSDAVLVWELRGGHVQAKNGQLIADVIYDRERQRIFTTIGHDPDEGDNFKQPIPGHSFSYFDLMMQLRPQSPAAIEELKKTTAIVGSFIVGLILLTVSPAISLTTTAFLHHDSPVLWAGLIALSFGIFTKIGLPNLRETARDFAKAA